jgi:endonuclease-3 related protein
VERAITNLRTAGKLSADRIRTVDVGELEQLVRPSGYFSQETKRLKDFVAFVAERYGRSLEVMRAMPTTQLREELSELNGIGAETADSILLYTGQHPIFVVDASMRRVLERHDAISAKAKYDEIRGLVEEALSRCEPEATDGSAVLDPQRQCTSHLR